MLIIQIEIQGLGEVTVKPRCNFPISRPTHLQQWIINLGIWLAISTTRFVMSNTLFWVSILQSISFLRIWGLLNLATCLRFKDIFCFLGMFDTGRHKKASIYGAYLCKLFWPFNLASRTMVWLRHMRSRSAWDRDWNAVLMWLNFQISHFLQLKLRLRDLEKR